MGAKIYKKATRPRRKSDTQQPAIGRPDFSKVVPVPLIFGYVRVSREDQNPDMQITAIKEAGCDRIFTDKLSGRTDQRPEFRLMLKHLQPGDTLLVWALSRLYRNTRQLLELFEQFNANDITLRSITESGINIRTSQGRLQAKLMAAFDEHEVERLGERTKAGMAERKRQGAVFGAPPKVSPAVAEIMKRMRFETRVPVPKIATRFKVSEAAVYHHTNQARAA